jgi:hypothetical protein
MINGGGDRIQGVLWVRTVGLLLTLTGATQPIVIKKSVVASSTMYGQRDGYHPTVSEQKVGCRIHF